MWCGAMGGRSGFDVSGFGTFLLPTITQRHVKNSKAFLWSSANYRDVALWHRGNGGKPRISVWIYLFVEKATNEKY